MNKFIFLSSISLLALSAAAQNITIAPGELPEKLRPSELTDRLSLTGSADIRDLKILRSLPADVKTVDLSALQLAEYNSPTPDHLGMTHFKAGVIPAYTFFKANFATITLPAGVTRIAEGALAASELTEIIIPEGVTDIDDYAFYGCPNLKKVTLPASLRSLGKGAFASCPSLTDVNLYDTAVKAIPDECFAGCSALTDFNADGILSVGKEAFSATSIVTLFLPEATYLAPFALSGMDSLRELTLNAEADFHEGTLMNNHRLVKIDGIPADIPSLFAANCISFTPEQAIVDARSIGSYAFTNSAISQIVLGSDLQSIDREAFKGAENLSIITATALDANIPAVDDNTFASLDYSKITVEVTDEAFDVWKAHPVWGQFNIVSPNNTAVDNILSDIDKSGISISAANGILSVSAPEPILSASVYDLNGALILSLPTGECRASAPTESLPSGVAIVSAATTSGRKTVKIIL